MQLDISRLNFLPHTSEYAKLMKNFYPVTSVSRETVGGTQVAQYASTVFVHSLARQLRNCGVTFLHSISRTKPPAKNYRHLYFAIQRRRISCIIHEFSIATFCNYSWQNYVVAFASVLHGGKRKSSNATSKLRIARGNFAILNSLPIFCVSVFTGCRTFVETRDSQSRRYDRVAG